MKRIIFLLALILNLSALAQTPWLNIPTNKWLTRSDIQVGINEGKLKVIGPTPSIATNEHITATQASSWVGVTYTIPGNRYITKQSGTWTDPNAKTRVRIYLDYEEIYDDLHGYRYRVFARSERPVDTPVQVNLWINDSYSVQVTIGIGSSSSNRVFINYPYNVIIRWTTPTESATQIYWWLNNA